MDFVAIDFETANSQPSSACQLAAVVVRDSQIAEEHCWLLRPPRMFFARMNISVHGIRPEDVANAPSLEQIWAQLSSIMDGQTLMAHNARFDMGVLLHSLAAYDIACPPIEFSCTRVLAKAAWPGKSGYGLKPLGNWLGIDFKHHDALEDARCCARIALAVAEAYSAKDLEALEKVLRISRGNLRHSRLAGPRMLRGKKGSQGMAARSTDRWGFPNPRTPRTLGAVDTQAVIAAAADELPLAGKRIVMLGPLRGLSLEQTLELISRLGASPQSCIGPDTDYVIACGTTLADASQLVSRGLPGNSARSDGESAEASQETQPPASRAPVAGGIRLLSERQFLALIPAGKASLHP